MDPNPPHPADGDAGPARSDDRDGLVGLISMLILYALFLPLAVPIILAMFAVFAVVDLVVYRRVPWTLIHDKTSTTWRRHAARVDGEPGPFYRYVWRPYRAWLLVSIAATAAVGLAIGAAVESDPSFGDGETDGLTIILAVIGGLLGGVLVWPALVALVYLCSSAVRLWRTLGREEKLLAATVVGSLLLWLRAVIDQRHRRP